METLQEIAVRELTLDPQNVRQAASDELSDQELAASIDTHGLLSNLVVKAEERRCQKAHRIKTCYSVVAGGRRLRALQKLIGDGRLAEDETVPCRVSTNGKVNVTELSLAENQARVALHPADQIDAFVKLSEAGLTAEEIAQRFGYAKRTVEARLRQANVDPLIRQAYREGRMNIETLNAFSAAEPPRQIAVYERLLDEKNDPETIHKWWVTRIMDESRESATSLWSRIVSIEEYEAAGGPVERDLFNDEVYFLDKGKLMHMVDVKLAEAVKSVEDDYAWVEARRSLSYDDKTKFGQAAPVPAETTDLEQTQLDKLQAELNDDGLDEWDDRSDEIERELEAIEHQIRNRDRYPPETGCIVTVGHEGVTFVGGLYRPGEKPKGVEVERHAKGNSRQAQEKKKQKKATGGLSDNAQAKLRGLRADMIRTYLTFDMAFDLLAFTLARSVFRTHFWVKPLDIGQIGNRIDDSEEGSCLPQLRQRVDLTPLEWIHADDPWAAYMELPYETRREVFTMAVAATMIPQLATDRAKTSAIEDVAHQQALEWNSVRPTAENFWNHMNRADILELALKELGEKTVKEESLKGMKKKLLADTMEDIFGTDGRTNDWCLPGFVPPISRAGQG